eukprot:CAMPEP_0197862504 /NCGR_PEP_ID=MMETSP1438-20131217/39325_1 /TAXON_ID=1461541 /ORGANISM="Pterosperma sp., Strain CCMP1384" /LENGTH=120 /DNA_ID=CAMNT_0043480085 /DNA_START=1059 /DNA_END=1421 /DNA_ORIENTATION=-
MKFMQCIQVKYPKSPAPIRMPSATNTREDSNCDTPIRGAIFTIAAMMAASVVKTLVDVSATLVDTTARKHPTRDDKKRSSMAIRIAFTGLSLISLAMKEVAATKSGSMKYVRNQNICSPI